MGIFFENTEEEYTIIEDTPLEEIAEEQNIEMPVTPISCSDRWGCYAYMKMMQATGDEVYSMCFAYYIPALMTDMGMSATAEEIYFKESLLDHVFHVVHDTKKEYTDETQQKKECYHQLFDEFKKGLPEYERKAFEYNARISDEIYDVLNKNGNKTEALIMFMNDEEDIPHVANNPPLKQFNFKLTWSEEKLYEQYKGDSATEKVVAILNNDKL